MKQMQRDRVMKKFKSGDLSLLVATDVAARGIDVENLDSVFNYDLPQEEEYYVHRIGRTGRNGKSGIAYSFISSKEFPKLKEIEKYANTKLKLKAIPSEKEIINIDNVKRIKNISEEIENANDEQIDVLEELNQRYSSKDIAKALYTLLYPAKTMAPIEIEEEAPRQRRSEAKSSGERRSGKRSNVSNNGMVRLFVNVGKKDKIEAKDLVGGIAAKTSISGSEIGKISILDSYSFVEVPKQYANDIIKDMKDKQIKGREVNLELANSR
jgi:ATP-dependent RNA helicase DeaD